MLFFCAIMARMSAGRLGFAQGRIKAGIVAGDQGLADILGLEGTLQAVPVDGAEVFYAKAVQMSCMGVVIIQITLLDLGIVRVEGDTHTVLVKLGEGVLLQGLDCAGLEVACEALFEQRFAFEDQLHGGFVLNGPYPVSDTVGVKITHGGYHAFGSASLSGVDG